MKKKSRTSDLEFSMSLTQAAKAVKIRTETLQESSKHYADTLSQYRSRCAELFKRIEVLQQKIEALKP